MSETIKLSFRLPRPYATRLVELSESSGVSPSVYARMLLVEAFEKQELHDIRDEVGEVRKFLHRFHEEFEAALEEPPGSTHQL